MTSDRKLLALLGIGTVLALAVVVAITTALVGGDDDASTSPALLTETVTETVYAEPDPIDEPLDEPVDAGPATSFGDGTYKVGVDVKAGRYRNDGDTYDGQAPCVAYTTRKPNDINTYVTGSTTTGPGILDVGRGLYLTVQGCQEWTRD